MRLTVLGSGRQGVAAGYDMARFGGDVEVLMLDRDPALAKAGADRINSVLGREVASHGILDASDAVAAVAAFRGSAVVLSAVPYFFNVALARAAVAAGASFGDLGGNTDVVRKELELHDAAVESGVSILPDLGLAPGLGNVFAVHAMAQMDDPRDVHVRCGGLPQNPQPPLDYMLVFAVEGLTNEYFGKAVYLRDGERVEVETFDELERLEFPDPIGEVEAFSTSGGTSTCPWTFEGRVRNYDYKTIRYPGHHARVKVMKDLGFLELEPVRVGEVEVVPRELFHTLAREHLAFPGERDLVLLRATCHGLRAGTRCTYEMEVVDYENEETGFTAMERMTAYPASIACLAMAHGQVEAGARPLEVALDAAHVVEELPKRGISLTIRES